MQSQCQGTWGGVGRDSSLTWNGRVHKGDIFSEVVPKERNRNCSSREGDWSGAGFFWSLLLGLQAHPSLPTSLGGGKWPQPSPVAPSRASVQSALDRQMI